MLPHAWQENSLTTIFIAANAAGSPHTTKQSPALVEERQASFRLVVPINAVSCATFRAQGFSTDILTRQPPELSKGGTVNLNAKICSLMARGRSRPYASWDVWCRVEMDVEISRNAMTKFGHRIQMRTSDHVADLLGGRQLRRSPGHFVPCGELPSKCGIETNHLSSGQGNQER
jgi:hypothetical protein